ncbi:MAG: S-layer homology domain-containing protein, partial [bacterium]|nr:S-layer homology domain-containing protein [bacterium]
KDIKKNYWAIPFIKSAYEIKIIAPSKYFKPKKYITKAEWGAILSKTPPVRKKLMKVFGQ